MAGDGVAFAALVVFTVARTQDYRPNQCQHSTNGMHHGGTCEVMEGDAECIHHERTGVCIAEPAAAPRPMSLHRIDDEGDEETVDAIHGKLGALRHGTGHDGGRRGAEDGLENQEALGGQSRIVGIEREVAEVGHSHEARPVAAEHEAEAHEPEEHRTDHEVHEILEEYVRRVLAPRKTGLTQREAGLHEEHEHRCKQHPHRIDRNAEIGDAF